MRSKVEIFDRTKTRQLSKSNRIYNSPFQNNTTPCLHFKVSWSNIPPLVQKIQLYISLTPKVDYRFVDLDPMVPGINYETHEISCLCTISANNIYIPFILHKAGIPLLQATFEITLCDENGAVINMKNTYLQESN